MLTNKTILITGGTGSWGHELVRQLIKNFKTKEIRIFSRGEHKQVDMKREFNNNPTLKFIIGDVRDKNILDFAMKNVDIVFHLAALKHVPVCEENCWETVLTNIVGTQNVIEAAIANNVHKVVDISTDKAVDPYNLYGITKACGEKLIVNSSINYVTDTKFVCIRGGNVMGTNGSVLPLFKQQILSSGELTITNPDMTRYLMSTEEAISLIFRAVETAIGGEVFVMRMPATTVRTMADTMKEILAHGREIKETIIGSRSGEKLHEVLVSKNESPRTKIYDDKYFVIMPHKISEAMKQKYSKLEEMGMDEFNSSNASYLDQNALKSIILKEWWLNN